jgi:hypothetical protein
MTPESPSIAELPQPSGMSELSRLTGVFFEPTKAFEDIGRRPRWLVPLLLTILFTLGFYYLYGQHVGWERFIQHQAQTSPKAAERMAQMTPAAREMQVKFMGIGYYAGTIIVMPIFYLITAAILLGIASGIMGAGLKLKQVFAIVCYAGLPAILKWILAMVVMFLKNPDDFNLMNPLIFNPAAFMDPLTSSKFVYTIASSIDLFAIWGMLLTAVGLSAAAGKKKLSFGSALIAVVVPWAVFVLFGASMASMFN